MWGNFITDLSYQTNYWFAFPNSNSDVLLNLGSWQYWWWFWFTFYMCLYYVLFTRLIRHRTLKFSPRITTSQKAHGKWGDFIICFVPIAWCVNILSNSNFILRMLEWQTESGSFMVRIRGRQWYWVYKIELQDLLKLEQVARNIGHDNWTRSFEKTTSTFQIELNSFILRIYERDVAENLLQTMKDTKNKFYSYTTNSTNFKNTSINVFANSNMFNEDITSNKYISSSNKQLNDTKRATIFNNQQLVFNNFKKELIPDLTLSKDLANNLTHTAYNINNRTRRLASFNNLNPIQLVKDTNKNILKWNLTNINVPEKNITENLYFVLKQKRYTPQIRKVNTVKVNTIVNQLKLTNSSILEMINEAHQTDRWLSKRLTVRSHISNLINNRRLLRTRRTLVLPANINITILTNSFDVVHSWYIPGLGLKVDCIPGRSSHHTLFIDNVGSYYGQCAEICGRYHHHMPIRICALPFDQFIIWWYHFGIPYFNATKTTRSQNINNSMLQYIW